MLFFRDVKTFLKIAGGILGCVVLGMAAIFAYVELQGCRVSAISHKFVPGITVEQVGAALPMDFFIARIGVPIREGPCKEVEGRVSAPEEILFPGMKEAEAEERRISDDAPTCEPPVSSFLLLGPVPDGKFRLRINLPNGAADPESKVMSRAESTDLLDREFKGREWIASFTYRTATPMYLSFHVVVGRDGKVREVSPVRGSD